MMPRHGITRLYIRGLTLSAGCATLSSSQNKGGLDGNTQSNAANGTSIARRTAHGRRRIERRLDIHDGSRASRKRQKSSHILTSRNRNFFRRRTANARRSTQEERSLRPRQRHGHGDDLSVARASADDEPPRSRGGSSREGPQRVGLIPSERRRPCRVEGEKYGAPALGSSSRA